MSDALVVTLTIGQLRALVREEIEAAFAARAPTLAPSPARDYERVVDFAARVSMSERRAWALVRSNKLPTIGKGRARRVDVRGALDALEREAAE